MAEKPSSSTDDMTVEKALEDYKMAFEYKRKFLEEADEDVEFALGDQWADDDIQKLKDKGVLPITINKIKPIIRLTKGIESQNRSESKAFPEGGEDSVEAEIATRLLKNAMKMDEGNYKVSELFGDGNICGESWIEPYLDNEKSLITADLGIRKSDHWTFCWDPRAKEYDLKDGQFLCKTTFDLTKDEVLSIYPDAEDKLDGTNGGRLDFDGSMPRIDELGADRQVLDYGKQTNVNGMSRIDVPLYDLLEYFYKKYVNRYYIVDARLGKIQEATKAQADEYKKKFNDTDPEGKKTIEVIKRRIPEIWVMAIVGGVEEPLFDGHAWSYPAWKSWPCIPYFAERFTIRMKNSKRQLSVQGITRDIKDLNRELNKRRTQELRHLNQSANSGWLTPENAWVDRDEVENEGAAPGKNLEYKPDIGKPERIFPQPLSQGHAQLAQEHANDMKEASGINSDLLASQEGGQDSGRAIAIRQKQGLVMVQGFFDNLSRTKKLLAKFILSQLPEIYTVERAMRVCGDAFIKENFTAPVMAPAVDPGTGQPMIDPTTNQPAMAPVMDPTTGQPQMQVDMKTAQQVFSKVLNDRELETYDIAIGENISQDTVQYANFLALMEMQAKGIPIPPDVLVDESLISSSQKEKIKAAIQSAAVAAQNAPVKKPQPK